MHDINSGEIVVKHAINTATATINVPKIKADAGRFIRAISIQFLRMVFVEFSNLAIYGNRYRLHKVTSIMIHKIILLNAPAPEFSSSIACKII